MSNLRSLGRSIVADWMDDKTAGKEALIDRITSALTTVYDEGFAQGEKNARNTKKKVAHEA